MYRLSSDVLTVFCALHHVKPQEITLSLPVNQNMITIVGDSYFQPIADLIERMLQRPAVEEGVGRANLLENGYATAITVLLVAMLESFVSRVRFLRNDEVVNNIDVPEKLHLFFPDLPNKSELTEVFMLRNIVVHNHVWHLDISGVGEQGAPTLATPKDLKFQPKKSYDAIVDVGARKTTLLGLSASPTSVDRYDVAAVFSTVWNTLEFMNEKNFSHTPLAGQTVKFKGRSKSFGELLQLLPATRPSNAAA